ncbi:MAG: S1C family serine protease [Planctomycetota bacterium]
MITALVTAPLLGWLPLLAPEEMDELEALQVVVRHAVDRVSPSIVTITTRGGIRKVDIPDAMKKKMTTPERPREGDPGAPRKHDEGKEGPEGREQPHFKNEWEKMLAPPGFKKAEGPTSGVIVSADGYVVTSGWNFESKPSSVFVTLPGRDQTFPARLLGIDRAAGLALLKIPAAGLPVPEFLHPDRVEVGAGAYALGRAIARERPEVKWGIISAKDRIEGKALQTDAAISPSNYGGPLIDHRGRVYGILVPLGARGEAANPNWYDSGIGFAVPIEDPSRLIERLGREGVVLEPAFLGVQMDPDRTEAGARIMKVLEGQPARQAGLQEGDVIVEIDGRKVQNSFTLRFAIGKRRAGDTVKLAVMRGEERLELTVTLAKRPRSALDLRKIPIPMPGGPGKTPPGRKPKVPKDAPEGRPGQKEPSEPS